MGERRKGIGRWGGGGEPVTHRSEKEECSIRSSNQRHHHQRQQKKNASEMPPSTATVGGRGGTPPLHVHWWLKRETPPTAFELLPDFVTEWLNETTIDSFETVGLPAIDFRAKMKRINRNRSGG